MTITDPAHTPVFPLRPPQIPPADRHAAAIAEVQSMKDLIDEQRRFITDYKHTITTMQDKINLLTQEAARWRTDAMACRTFVVKLATIQEIISDATKGSKLILDDMAQMDAEPNASNESIKDVANRVQENLKKLGESSGSNSIPPVQEGPPSNT